MLKKLKNSNYYKYQQIKKRFHSSTKFLIFCDGPGPTYQISFKNPLEHSGLKEFKQFSYLSEAEIDYLEKNDLLIPLMKHIETSCKIQRAVFTRFSHPQVGFLLNFFKRHNIKSINHFDDLLIEVPENLGAEIYNRLNVPVKILARKKLIDECDLNYVSTSYLKDKIQRLYPGSTFFNGIYAAFTNKFEVSNPSEEHFKVGYMGSKGHSRDIEPLIPHITELLKNNEEVHFEFFGTILPPKILLEKFPKRIRHHCPEKNYYDFLRKLSTLNWNLAIAPLIDDDWNRCKAPTKFIEYTMSQIPVVASDMEVYRSIDQGTGSIKFVEDDDWYKALNDCIQNPNERDILRENALKLCQEEYNLDVLSKQVLDVLHL